MQKHVNLVDLVKSFPTNIFLQDLASIQKRTNPIKFAHLAEESENGSISNLSTKVTSPHWPRSYGHGEACTIVVQEAGTLVATDFDTEPGYDVLAIGDGDAGELFSGRFQS